MKIVNAALLAVLPLLALAACGQKAENKAAVTSAATSSAPANESASGGSRIGVPECDNYFDKVKACIKDKIPEAQRAAMEQAIEQSKASWAAISDKTELAKACKAATEQAKATYAAMGCSL